MSLKGACSPGDARVDQAWHRNAATDCAAATFNFTNALRVVWRG